MKKFLLLLIGLVFSLSIIAQKSDYEKYIESKDSSKSVSKDTTIVQNQVKDTVVQKIVVINNYSDDNNDYYPYLFLSCWYSPYFGWYSPYFYPTFWFVPFYHPFYNHRPYRYGQRDGYYNRYNNYSRYNNVQRTPVYNVKSYTPTYNRPSINTRPVYNVSRPIQHYSAPRSQGFRGSISHSSGRR